MTVSVVDTNVPIVANGKSPQADPACVVSALQALTTIQRGGTIGLDDSMRILTEYMQNLNMSGQPGAGDIFMKWVWTVQADEEFCTQVQITPRQSDPSNFEEFPDDRELEAFDPSDRKFVAVALKIGPDHLIVNAVDSDWANFHDALSKHDVKVRFLCPQHVCPPP